MPRISVVVPTYRRPALLERALASIAAQSLPPDKVIVVDDDPQRPPRARAIADATGLKQVRVVPNARARGVSGARNTGAALADADLLAFLDDDDEWLPPFLSETSALFEAEALDLVCTDFLHREVNGAEQPGKTAPERLVPEAFLVGNPGLRGSNVVVRRTRFLEIGGFDESLPTLNDIDFGLRLALCAGLRYRPLHRRLVRFHKHRGARLSSPRSTGKREGIRRFHALHAHRMSASQRIAFRDNALRLWGIDERGRAPGEVGR